MSAFKHNRAHLHIYINRAHVDVSTLNVWFEIDFTMTRFVYSIILCLVLRFNPGICDRFAAHLAHIKAYTNKYYSMQWHIFVARVYENYRTHIQLYLPVCALFHEPALLISFIYLFWCFSLSWLISNGQIPMQRKNNKIIYDKNVWRQKKRLTTTTIAILSLQCVNGICHIGDNEKKNDLKKRKENETNEIVKLEWDKREEKQKMRRKYMLVDIEIKQITHSLALVFRIYKCWIVQFSFFFIIYHAHSNSFPIFGMLYQFENEIMLCNGFSLFHYVFPSGLGFDFTSHPIEK